MEKNVTTRRVKASNKSSQHTLRTEGIMSGMDPNHRQGLTKTLVDKYRINETYPLKNSGENLIRRFSCLRSRFSPGFEPRTVLFGMNIQITFFTPK